MERIFYLLKQSLFVKLALVATLVIGGGNSVWGDEYLFNGNKQDGWTISYNSYSSGDLSGATYGSTTRTYTSNDPITISIGQKIIINAKRNTSSSAINSVLKVNYFDGSAWQTISEYSTSDFVANSTYYDFEVENVSLVGNKRIQFEFFAVAIKSIVLVDAPVVATLSISPEEDAEFGTIWADASKVFEITNNTGSAVSVIPSVNGLDAAFFSVYPSMAVEIAAGETEIFTVNYTYNSESLGEKVATIIFTPNNDNEEAIFISATANAVSDNAPQMSVTPYGNIDFGNVYNGTTTFTVTNTGTGQMSVNISSDNGDFTVSPSLIEGLGNGESETLTVTYTFAATADKLGVNSANITVTPTYDGCEAQTYQVSATSNATMTLDEDNATTVNYGSKAFLHVKYKPSAGWNTISMPFMLRNSDMDNMSAIFGEGWKAYALSSYNNGILTFSKVLESATVNNGTPYLVYISEAPNHPNGVLLSDISTTGNNPNSTIKNGATFQGTYVRKDFVENDDWYGVTSSGQVLQAGEGAYVKGYRAYFTGIQPPANGARVSIVLEGDGTTTDLGFVKMVDKDATDVYTLSGQKVQKAGKGLYIVNGRKVVIK